MEHAYSIYCSYPMPPPDWKARYHTATEKIAALKQRIELLEGAVAAARAPEREQAHKARVERLETRLREQGTSLEWAKTHALRSHRGVPSPTVIRRTLPLRLPVAQARARRPDAVAAEARFLAQSPTFAAALASVPQPPAVDTPIVRSTLQGLHWWVPVLRPRDAEPGSPWLRKQKFPYRGIAQTRELAMGGLMIDLGANIGRMSLSRVILGDVAAVYCAEPDPINYECLVRNIADNGLRGLVFPDNVAIGDREGEAVLKRAKYCGGHTLVDGAVREAGTVAVRTSTLDDWTDRVGIDRSLVTFIKVDVQGWEGHVFAGAAQMLRQRQVTWQIEFKPELLRTAGTDPIEFCRRLRDSFTHFTDLNKTATGERGRPIADVEEAVAYVEGSESGQTDLLLFNQQDA